MSANYLSKPEKVKTLYVDPGEDTGWCLANGPKLLAAGTEKLWPFADQVWQSLASGGAEGPLGGGSEALAFARKGIGPKQIEPPIGRIVCEDFRIYPNKAKALSWDPVRTARLIGALTMMTRVFDVPFFLQPAAIKPEALALGAEEYYYSPHHENRHQNDAIQHFVCFRAFGPNGSPRTANRTSAAEQGKAHEAAHAVQQCTATKSVKRNAGRKVRYDKLVCRKPEGHRGDHFYVA